MAGFTRTHGANARAESWDDFLDEEHQPTGSWLPLDGLEDNYGPGPQLRSMPGTRRGPLAPQDLPAEVRQTARHQTHAPQQAANSARKPSESITIRGLQAKAIAMLAGAAIAALALYVAVSAAVEWTQVKVDDLQYGRPRTTQLDAYVGHNEAAGVPTHFVAMNLNRRVTVLELPGGDSAKATAIVGPYLFGEGEDLTPVQEAAEDVNGDGKPDLVLSVKSEQLIYLNDGAAFKLMTPEEQAALQKTQAGRQARPGSEQAPAAAPGAGK